MEPTKFILPSISLPKLKLVIETYYLAGREKPDEYFGGTELALFSEKLSSTNKVNRNQIAGCISLLKQIGLLEHGKMKREYRLNQLGTKLGQTIKDQMIDRESSVWRNIVPNCSFLLNIYSYILGAVPIEQEDLKKEIVSRSGGRAQTTSAQIGAQTIIDILAKGGFIIKKDKDRSHKMILVNSNNTPPPYISDEIISSLRTINSKYDLSKLIELCEEINKCYNDKSYYAVGILNRVILDHIPPVFGHFEKFKEVFNSYSGSRSFREHIENLDLLTRKVADDYAHGLIKAKENLANPIQVNFSSSFDVLLHEIIRILS